MNEIFFFSFPKQLAEKNKNTQNIDKISINGFTKIIQE